MNAVIASPSRRTTLPALPLWRDLPLPHGHHATLRPVFPDDMAAQQAFVEQLSPSARRNRFHGAVQGLSEATLRRLCDVDQQRHVGLLLTLACDGRERVIGEARYAVADDGVSAEFALAIADEWQGCGLALQLLAALTELARRAGLRWLIGEVLADNATMLACTQAGGFAVSPCRPESGVLRVERSLNQALTPPHGLPARLRRGARRLARGLGIALSPRTPRWTFAAP